MKKPREDDIRIAAEAAQWQRALQSGGPEVRAQFADWVRASPRHLHEFMLMEALDAAATDIDPLREIDVDVDLSTIEETVVSLPGTSRQSSCSAPLLHQAENRANDRVSLRPFATAAAATALIAAVGLMWWLVSDGFGDWKRYGTDVGEQRTVELQDGSVLQLNTKSAVRVRFSDRTREIRLTEGEALFKVAHDPSRPFRVRTDEAVIRAVGTQFNVDRHSSGTRVAVLEGKVEVRRLDAPRLSSDRGSLLAAGEAARIEDSGEVVLDIAADISEVTAWRERRLVFREETLANIANEFNRYNRSPQIVIEGDAARDRRYGGTFDADDPESLVEFVMRRGDLNVERSAARILIRAK